ncbi:MAG: hypothetical protein GY801_37665 [bacterium]|nr:hypothetical protein [bacterium]
MFQGFTTYMIPICRPSGADERQGGYYRVLHTCCSSGARILPHCITELSSEKHTSGFVEIAGCFNTWRLQKISLQKFDSSLDNIFESTYIQSIQVDFFLTGDVSQTLEGM